MTKKKSLITLTKGINHLKNSLSLTVGTNKLKCFSPGIIDQVASNKSSLLLKTQKSNKRTLQLFTEIIKTEKYMQK